MDKWGSLTQREKAEIMRMAVGKGLRSLDEIRDFYNTYADGGDLDTVLNRANSVYNNYSDARDFHMNPLVYGIRKAANYFDLPSGISNCTLTASQWVDPSNPIKSADTIFNGANTGYYPISEEEALPGDLLITRNPEKGSYHTMLIEGYDKNNKPILRYSTGGSGNDSLRTGIPYDRYHRLDKEQGGNHTEDHYFRYNYPNTVNMGPVVVKPQYANGGKIHIDPSKKGTFTAAASKHGKSVQEFASQVLANPDNYSPAMRKKANFARNASKWHADGGWLLPMIGIEASEYRDY